MSKLTDRAFNPDVNETILKSERKHETLCFTYLLTYISTIAAGASAGDDDARQKKEILTSLRAFNTFGIWVKHEGQKAVMLCLSKDPLQCMNEFGPSSAFKAERFESFKFY
ncbi:hypothetical protein EMCRGX_G017936 [Ephydatia muelleri]